MKYSNILEKLEIIINLIIDSKLLTVLTFLLIIPIILRLLNIINSKKVSIIIFLIEFIILGLTIYNNNSYFITSSNSVIEELFKNFYFPSIYVYLLTFLSSLILFIFIHINKYISNTYKKLNKIYFYLYNFINILLVSEIAINKIDVLKKESLFTNNNILVLLELSIYLFFIYLVINVLFYITNNIVVLVLNKKKLNIKEKEFKDYNLNLLLEDNFNDKLEQEYENKDLNTTIKNKNNIQTLNINKTNISFNDLVKETTNNKIDLIPEIDLSKNNFENNKKNIYGNKNYNFIDKELLHEDISNNEKENNISTIDIPTITKEKIDIIKDFNNEIDKQQNSKQVITKQIHEDKAPTLNDYKLFSKMLRTVLENNSNRNNLTIKELLNKEILFKYTYDEYKQFEKILNSCMN